MSTSRKQQKLAAGIDGVEVEKKSVLFATPNRIAAAPIRRVLVSAQAVTAEDIAPS